MGSSISTGSACTFVEDIHIWITTYYQALLGLEIRLKSCCCVQFCREASFFHSDLIELPNPLFCIFPSLTNGAGVFSAIQVNEVWWHLFGLDHLRKLSGRSDDQGQRLLRVRLHLKLWGMWHGRGVCAMLTLREVWVQVAHLAYLIHR